MFFRSDKLTESSLPKHLSIIMDGNRRWAQKKSIQRKLGHYEGAKNLKKIILECLKLKISYLTVYAFSTENWNRKKLEVDELTTLLEDFLENSVKELLEYDIAIRVIGDLSKFSKKIQTQLTDLQNKTKKSQELSLNIALNYGAREEIIYAVNSLLQEKTKLSNITTDQFSKYLYTKDIPDPDLVIRTSGEYRLSNFLLWQSAYSEFYFSKKLWPEFSVKELHKALLSYTKRKRRFGY